MTEDLARLVREIKQLTNTVTSFVVTFWSSSNLQLMPLKAEGRTYFLSPDRFRSEISIRDSEIVTVRKGNLVQRYIPKRKELWRYTLEDLPQTEPINFAVADLKDPFFAVDEATLEYEGELERGDVSVHVFFADSRNWAKQGMLDTRRGYSIRFKPQALQVRIMLYVDCASGLLRKISGSDKTGKQLFESNYSIESVNTLLDESLFTMDESTASYRVIDITDSLLSSMNPDAADAPPSQN